MNPDQFYRQEDLPTRKERTTMWKHIAAGIRPGAIFLSIPDRRSFFYGMAAAILLILSGFGLSTVLGRFAVPEQPAELRFDEAYRSAIREFEEVLPAVSRESETDRARELLQTRRQQIAMIDAAILELRNDIERTDLSALKRSRLRQLYALKLQALLEIIEQGDLES